MPASAQGDAPRQAPPWHKCIGAILACVALYDLAIGNDLLVAALTATAALATWTSTDEVRVVHAIFRNARSRGAKGRRARRTIVLGYLAVSMALVLFVLAYHFATSHDGVTAILSATATSVALICGHIAAVVAAAYVVRKVIGATFG